MVSYCGGARAWGCACLPCECKHPGGPEEGVRSPGAKLKVGVSCSVCLLASEL